MRTVPREVGYTGDRYHVNGFLIKTRIDRVAYAKNGNAHNPTVYKSYHLFEQGCESKLLGRFNTLREARAAAQETK